MDSCGIVVPKHMFDHVLSVMSKRIELITCTVQQYSTYVSVVGDITLRISLFIQYKELIFVMDA